MPKQSALFVLCQQLRLDSLRGLSLFNKHVSDFSVITCDVVIERRAFDGAKQQLK